MKRNPSDNPLDMSAIHLLHRAGQCAGEIFAGEMRRGDLTPRQYAILLTVARNEGLSQTGLVERTGVDRSTLADIIRRMLNKGLLQRKRTKEDARAYAVHLTEKGRRALKSAQPSAAKADKRLLAALSQKQQDQFLKILNTIVKEAEKAMAKPAKKTGRKKRR